MEFPITELITGLISAGLSMGFAYVLHLLSQRGLLRVKRSLAEDNERLRESEAFLVSSVAKALNKEAWC